MPDRNGPVSKGDRVLLHPSITSLAELTWGEVEIVDHVEDPTSLPWNAGPAFPYRVGFRVDMVTKGDVVTAGYGTIWLNAEGNDPVGGVRRIGFAAARSASQ